MFGEIAGRYDFLNHLLSLHVDRYWRWRTVRQVAPLGDGPILDVCTGTGDLALAYVKRATDRVLVVGADFCRPMLELGQKKAHAAGRGDRLSFVEADALALPFAEGTFQIVCIGFGLRNISDTDGGLRELVRVCAAGGRVAVLEFSMPRWQPFRALYGWYFRRVLPRIGRLFSRSRDDAYSYLPDSVSEFPDGPALVERMRAAGLERATYYPLTLGIATLYMGQKPA